MNLPFKCYSIKNLLMTLTMLATYSTSGFAVWQTPATQLSGFGNSLDMAADANGHAVTIYSNDLEGPVFASYYTNGAWTPSQPISVSLGSAFVAVDMDATGTALAVWNNLNDSTIESARFSGGFWGIPFPNPIETVSGPTRVDVAMDGSGRGVAIWADGAGNMRSSFFSGGVWGPVETIGTGGSFPKIAYSANGTVVAGWNDGGVAMVANYIGGSWQAPVTLDPAIQLFGNVGIDADGNALAIWKTSTLSGLASYFDGTSWLPPVTVFPDPVVTNLPPVLAMSPGGQAVAAWFTSTGTGVSSSFNGTSWSTLLQYSPGPITDFDVSINPTNDAGLVVWATDTPIIYSSKLPLGGVWSPQEFVANPTVFGDVLVDMLVAASSDNGTDFASWLERGVGGEGGFPFAIATLAPLGPLNLAATTCTNRFASQTDRVNIITWTASVDPLVVSYELRRNGILIATIPSGGPFIYADHHRCRRVADVYILTAIDVNGGASAPSIITVL